MKNLLYIAVVMLTPVLTFAQTAPEADLSYFNNFAARIGELINNFLIPLVIALAVLVFLWGVFKAFILASDDDARKEGRKLMLWGVIAFVVMVALWGIVELVANVFGVASGPSSLPPPGTPTVGGAPQP